MKRCEKCGAEVMDESSFCTECGAPLKVDAPSEAPAEEKATKVGDDKGEPAKTKKPKKKKEPPREEGVSATQPEFIAAPKEVEEKAKVGDTAPVVPPKDVPESKPSTTGDKAKPAPAKPGKPKKKRIGLIVLFIVVGVVLLIIAAGVVGYYWGWFDRFLYAEPAGITETFDNMETATFQNIYVDEGGQVKIQAGEMLLANGAVRAVKDVGTDYAVKVRLKFISVAHSEGWAGIIVRINPSRPTFHYAFQLYPEKDLISISKISESGIEELSSFAAQIDVNYEYRLEVSAKGKDFSFIVNGQKFLVLTDITLNSGGAGLEAYYSQALFDDFTMEPLGE